MSDTNFRDEIRSAMRPGSGKAGNASRDPRRHGGGGPIANGRHTINTEKQSNGSGSPIARQHSHPVAHTGGDMDPPIANYNNVKDAAGTARKSFEGETHVPGLSDPNSVGDSGRVRMAAMSPNNGRQRLAAALAARSK